MDLNKFSGEPITLVRTKYSETERDSLGQFVSVTEKFNIKGIIGYSSTNTAGKPFNEIQESRLIGIFDFGTDIREGDKLECRGTVFEIDGEIITLSPTLAPSFRLKAPLKLQLRAVGNIDV